MISVSTVDVIRSIAIVLEFTILVLTLRGLVKTAALVSVIGSTISEQALWYCAAAFLLTIPAVVSGTFEHARA